MIACGRFGFTTSFLAPLMTVGLALGADPKPPQGPMFNCGTIALYHLLKLEARAIDLDRIASTLPPCPVEGYSMRELRDAGEKLGIKLVGVQLPKGANSPGRPVLAFVKRGDHGHYVVVRPVGPTGKRIQVLDLDQDPTVLDASTIHADPSWTGLALVADDASGLGHA